MQIENSSLKTKYQFWERGKPMKHDFNWKALKKEEVNISYNMGLEMALFVLEMAEGLSPERRKHLLDLLKKNIAESERFSVDSYDP